MTAEEKSFILFNNRSKSLVMRFLNETDPKRLSEIESMLSWVSMKYSTGRVMEINANDILDGAPDPSYGPADVADRGNVIHAAHAALLDPADERQAYEREWLSKRGIKESTILRYGLGSLSSIPDSDLEAIGASCHPALAELLDPSRGPGITIPLFENGVLVNVTTRRIDDLGKLKYTQACPDVHVWGVESVRIGKPIHVAEGLFDMMALHSIGLSAVSVSSAMWSGPQILALVRIAQANKCGVVIVADNDQPGLRCARVMQRVLSMNGLSCETATCEGAKDPAEMIFENGRVKLLPVNITKEMIASGADTSFNFTEYLRKRQF